MKIEVRDIRELQLATCLAMQIPALNKILSKALGRRTEVTEIEFEFAWMHSEPKLYDWDLSLSFSTWTDVGDKQDGRQRYGGLSGTTFTPDQHGEGSIHMQNALYWLFGEGVHDHAIGQEFGMDPTRTIRISA